MGEVSFLGKTFAGGERTGANANKWSKRDSNTINFQPLLIEQCPLHLKCISELYGRYIGFKHGHIQTNIEDGTKSYIRQKIVLCLCVTLTPTCWINKRCGMEAQIAKLEIFVLLFFFFTFCLGCFDFF